MWHARDHATVVMGGHPTRLWGMNTGLRQVGRVQAFIGDQGLRGEPPELPRPEGRHRIALVGDSTFFGHGIEDNETIISRTVGLFAADGLDVDGINGGIPGYSTEQTIMLLDEEGWDLEPTLLLIGNLWSDNNFDHFRDADLLRTRKMWNENPLSRSSLFVLVASILDGLRDDSHPRVVTWMRSSEAPDHGVRRVPVKRYAENLDLMVREAAKRGIQSGIVSPVNRLMTIDDLPNDVAWGPYFAAQAAVAAHHGIAHIDLAPTLIEAAKTHGSSDLYLDEMHPTPLGSTYFASAVHTGLVDFGWPERTSLAQGAPFDSSGIQDVVRGSVSLTVNELSPQANLYPDLVSDDQKAPGDTTESYEPSYWRVTGKVVGAEGDVELTVVTAEGDPVRVSKLTAPYTFTVPVSGSITLTRVVATTQDGRRATADCFKDCAPVTLSFE